MKKGDVVLFVENSEESSVLTGQFGALFYKIAGLELGLDARFFSGIGVNPPLNVADQLLNDFEAAEALVTYLGKPKQGSDYADNWALTQLQRALDKGMPCFVYVHPEFPRDLLGNAGFPYQPVSICSTDEFREVLTRDLKGLQA